MHGELAELIFIGEYKRNPKYDEVNVEVSKGAHPCPFFCIQMVTW